ncbi:alpha/beta family hydrolase [Stutzerimonas tarimensis]|uniref:Alpha/beta family hydrolase n=1 Tax=Stutzerimonas tarimensis TaxID=1507735 RepID=A0ABV7T6A4_9GAMM
MEENVSLLWDRPAGAAVATLILAHGAGAPMDSAFMEWMAKGLMERGVTVVRFEFAYMAGRRTGASRRPPDPMARLLQRWREAYEQVRQQAAGPLAIGGKSMGGRMASLLADELAASALVCLGYPFYASGKPDKPRVAHLAQLKTPTLIIQGERDALGNREQVANYALADSIELLWMPAADHDLKPLKRSGFSHDQHLSSACERIARWLQELPSS